jgi:ArsR family transcriptional regulator
MLREKNISQAKKIGRLFRMLGQPARIRILMTIGKGEACVCHLEAVLGYRQAYISQHLMALRKLKLVAPRRDGRNIYYRITSQDVLNLVEEAGDLLGLPSDEMLIAEAGAQVPGCACPHCEPEQVDVSLIQVKQETTTPS